VADPSFAEELAGQQREDGLGRGDHFCSRVTGLTNDLINMQVEQQRHEEEQTGGLGGDGLVGGHLPSGDVGRDRDFGTVFGDFPPGGVGACGPRNPTKPSALISRAT